MSNRCFRPVRPDEVERIAQIAVRAWQPIYAYYREALGEELFARLYTGWEERKADQVRQAARARPDCVYVTEIDGAIAGFITFMVNPETGVGEIGNNAVDPECQASGSARRSIGKPSGSCASADAHRPRDHGPRSRTRPPGALREKAGFDHSMSSITYYMDLSDL